MFAVIAVIVFVVIPLLVGILCYLTPTIVAISRKKHDKGLIMTLNILMGWLMPVWIYTCVCAFLDNPQAD